MPVRRMTPQEVRDWLGSGIVLPGHRRNDLSPDTNDLLKECIGDLRDQLQEWLGSDTPREGTEDYETWQASAWMIEQIQSLDDVYELCESGGFVLPSVLA